MSVRKAIVCGLLITWLPLAELQANCDGGSCGLSGARGKMEDESRVMGRPFSVEKLPALPEQSERVLPTETLMLWGLTDRDLEGDVVLTEIAEADTVILRDEVPHIRFESGRSLVSEEFVQSLRAVLERLREKQNLRVHVIGHTDPERLSARSQAIYGDNHGLGLDRAKRVGKVFQQHLGLSNEELSYDSKGPDEPIASNDTAQGMAMNRRVEVQIWYDEPALRSCDKPIRQVAAVVLDDALPVVRFESGRSIISDEYIEQVRSALQELEGKEGLRLHIVGHTDPEHLSARSAAIFGDNYGLGMDRARRVGKAITDRLGLAVGQITYDSKGPDQPIASNDNAEGMALNRRVVVQIRYDEVHLQAPKGCPAVPVVGKCPDGAVAGDTQLPFRLSVDGMPVLPQDVANSADVQRCVDVALERDHLQLQYDNLSTRPALNVAIGPRTAQVGMAQQIQGYSNYLHWIERAEVRIYGKRRLWGEPELLKVIELDEALAGTWVPTDDLPTSLFYVLRVYDNEGRYDETKEQALNLLRGKPEEPELAAISQDLARAYGENRLHRHTIPVSGGSITVNGKAVDAAHSVYVMGKAIAVDPQGQFATRQIIPRGLHTVEVAVLNDEGQGRIYRRDLRLPQRDWFVVAIADMTVGQQDTTGPAHLVSGSDRYYDDELYVDGRIAFYAKGKLDGKYTVTTSVDTGEEPAESLLSNFSSKDPREYLRRMDANRHWPTFGDDSTLEEDAPTRGKLYARIEDGKSHAMWGNFRQQTLDTELAQIDRSLYGAQLRHQGEAFTAFGERRLALEGFAAQPGTSSSREEFRGTGGSVYFLRHQDITQGSERIRVEVRDRDSNVTLHVNQLSPGIDYDIDWIQGRVLLSEPLSGSADASTLVQASGLSGNPVYLVVGYEYSPGFDKLDDISTGIRASYWLSDSVRIGATASRQEEFGEDQDLNGIDLTLRKSDATWLKLEGAHTDGAGRDEQLSFDGGFGFSQRDSGGGRARANRAEAAIGMRDLGADNDGRATLYSERREAGFSAPGRMTTNEVRQSGASVALPVGENTEVMVKGDSVDNVGQMEQQSAELGIAYQLDEQWRLSAGMRHEERNSTTDVGDGRRDDAALKAEFRSEENWTAHGFVQGTVHRDGERLRNNRIGVGGSTQVNERTSLMGEVSDGDLGPGAKAGVDYAASDRTNLYLNYQLDNDRADNGIAARRGQVVTGARSRWTDTTSVYAENRYQHGDQSTGLLQAYGVDIAPNDRWSYGFGTEIGRLNLESDEEIRRLALSASLGYSNSGTRYGGLLEFREDKTDLEDRTVWLVRNNFTNRLNPDWRLVARLDFALGKSSRGDEYNGDFVEASLGYAYRPVANDRLNMLTKYTYLADLPPPEQISTATGSTVDFAQRSHVLALDTLYDLTPRWTVGAKYAQRYGELRPSRDNSADWFSSRGQLLVLRADWHVVHKWDAIMEWRRRDEFAAKDSRSGALLGIQRHLGQHFKAGIGYNFTDFSDDLTDMSFRSQGWFINLVGKY